MKDEREPEAIDAEVIEDEGADGLPVLAEVRPVADRGTSQGALPAVQAAAAAATGFVAGAATLVVMQRLAARRLARVQPAGVRRGFEFLPVVSSRTFIVDVHLVGKHGE
jgi:hypothetical protein